MENKKYVKVVFGTKSGANSDYTYKINEVNIATNWNKTATSGKDFGGFNFSVPDKILRWLHRGDTLYDVTIPADAEVIDIVDSATPHGVFRTNKIILSNPRKITDDLALELYKISTIPEQAYPKALGAVSIMNYKKTALQIFTDKVNKDHVELYLSEWNDFMAKDERQNVNETMKLIKNKLLELSQN